MVRFSRFVIVLVASCLLVRSLHAQPFYLPTANRAIYEPGGEDKFFAPTPGKTWTSGCFGCVRSDGHQLHEGLDIRAIQRDKRDEPTDPVMASADGTVAYINSRPSLSNYGNYIVLRHQIEGLDIYTLYAHLKEIGAGLKVGQTVKTGQVIAIMGRTSNTAETITKDRAHVHFEIDLVASDHFSAWYKKFNPGERNDHGDWNGQNLMGIDPRLILLQEHSQTNFSLLNFIRSKTTLCRVFVRVTDFSYLRRYPQLIQPNPRAQKEGVVGYEIALDFNGVPCELIPRSASEIPGKPRFQLLSVNETEEAANPCRRLVVQRGGRWELANNGNNLLELLTY